MMKKRINPTTSQPSHKNSYHKFKYKYNNYEHKTCQKLSSLNRENNYNQNVNFNIIARITKIIVLLWQQYKAPPTNECEP